MKIKIAAIVMALTAAASMRFGQTANTETDAQTGTVKATDTAQVSFSAKTNMTDTEVETATDAPQFTVEFELVFETEKETTAETETETVSEYVTEHETEFETTAPTEKERAEETTGPAESEAEPEPPKLTLSVTFEVSERSEKETDAETTAHVTEAETTAPVTETEPPVHETVAPETERIPETASSSTTAESSSTTAETETASDTMPENEPIPEAEFNIDYRISFARGYAESVDLNLDETAVGCWDNPITASAKSAYLERDIKSRINRYAKDGSIFDVWIWAEANTDGSFNIYIGYA